MRAGESTQELIAEIPLLRGLVEEDRRRLGRVAAPVSFVKGGVLFREGFESAGLYAVVRGRVKVLKTVPGGREMILGLFGPGDLIGAVAVYQDRPYPASAVALEPTLCLGISKRGFLQLLESSPSLVRGLLSALSERLVVLTNRLAEQTGRLETRYARLFLKLTEEVGRPSTEGILVPVALSRQELADLVGTTIETSIRILSRWGKQGIVRTEKSGFIVVDQAALSALARD